MRFAKEMPGLKKHTSARIGYLKEPDRNEESMNEMQDVPAESLAIGKVDYVEERNCSAEPMNEKIGSPEMQNGSARSFVIG